MASFDIAKGITLQKEGAYQDNPKDIYGNYNSLGQLIGTNWGISAPTLEAYLGRVPTLADMKGLSQATAINIYRKNYWNAYKLGNITSQAIANQLFDINVLQGPRDMADIAQDALNALGFKITNDRSFGPITLETINQAVKMGKEKQLNETMVSLRMQLLHSKPDSSYWKGWFPRAESFLNASYQVAKSNATPLLLLALVGAGVFAYSRYK